MATKLYNTHINKLMCVCKSKYTLDCYIALSYISTEIDGKFYIQAYSDKKVDLVNSIRPLVHATYRTVYNSIDNLIIMNILGYDETTEAWLIKDMEYMVKKKDENDADSEKCTGYFELKPYLLTEEFQGMKYREQKVFIYQAQVIDGDKYKYYGSFKIDLNNPNSMWYKILNTKSKYYARRTIEDIFKKYPNAVELLVQNDSAKNNYKPKKIQNFRFNFLPKAIKKKTNDDANFDKVTLLHNKEYCLIKDSMAFFEVTLTKTEQMHLIRGIYNVKNWLLKERIVNIILKKIRGIQLHNNKKISSLPKYLAAVIKSVVDEYKFVIDRLKKKKEIDYSIDLDNPEYYTDQINSNCKIF